MSIGKRVLRGTLATFGSTVVRLVAQALILLVLTRVFLEPEEYGLLFLAVSVFGVLHLFSNLGLPKSTGRYVAEYREADPSQVRFVVRRSLAVLAVPLTVVCVFTVLYADVLAAVFDEPDLAPLLAIGAAYVAFNALYGYVMIVLQGFGRVELSALVTTVKNTADLCFIVLFLASGFGVVGALTGFIAGYATGVFVGFWLVGRLYREFDPTREPEAGLVRRLIEYSVPLTVTQSGNVLYKRVDTLLIGFFLSPLEVGYYELAKQVSAFVMAPAESLGFSVAPVYAELRSGAEVEKAARMYEITFTNLVLLYLPAVAGIVLLAEPGIRYVFGDAYLGAVPVLQIFSLFVLFQAIDKITNDSLDYLGRARERAIGKGVTAVLNFGLNLVLIPTVGIVGAAAATSFSFGLMVAYNVYIVHSELGFDVARVARFSSAAVLVTGCMSVVVFTLQSHITGLLTLALTVIVGATVWGLLSVASGLLDRRRIESYL